jgi:hypothetical protein
MKDGLRPGLQRQRGHRLRHPVTHGRHAQHSRASRGFRYLHGPHRGRKIRARRAAIPRFLQVVRSAGVPAKIDSNYLKTVGLKNTNDKQLVPAFKTLGFLDSSGRPTETYRKYKQASNDGAAQVLGSAVKTAYAGLFSLYPDAHRRDDEAISNWIRGNSDASDKTLARALSTFKVLRDAASFDDVAPLPVDVPAPADTPNGSTANQPSGVPAVQAHHVQTRTGPDVTININLQIAATNDATIYDQFFAAMKKHLFPDAN